MIELLKKEWYEVIGVNKHTISSLNSIRDDVVWRGVKFAIVVTWEHLLDMWDEWIKIMDKLNNELLPKWTYYWQSARSGKENLYCVRYTPN